MGCIQYDNTCTSCKWGSFDRSPVSTCPKCGEPCHSHREWDEEDDYKRERWELTHISKCYDEWGDNCPEEEE